MMRLSLFAAFLILAAPAVRAADDPQPIALPREWVVTDVSAEQSRFGVVAAEFPSTLLAEGVASTLTNLGWMPVRVAAAGNVSQVLVGDFATAGDAVFLADELRLQKLAEARPVRLPASLERAQVEIAGPFVDAFLDRGVEGQAPMTLDKAFPILEAVIASLPQDERPPLRRAFDDLRNGTGADVRGPAAAELARLLDSTKREADVALFLATNVASGEWTAPDTARLACAELAADLLMEHRRDWRGAWSATRSLLAEPTRKDAARGRDLLRRGALETELAAGAGDVKPSFAAARATLRQAWDATPKTEYRQLAQIELVYLKTFGMDGDWDSVELLADEFLRRHLRTAPGESLSARLWLARSQERREAWREAIANLERVASTTLLDAERLYTGFEPQDIQSEALRLRLRFVELSATAQAPSGDATPAPQ